jgi:PKD repeat protein
MSTWSRQLRSQKQFGRHLRARFVRLGPVEQLEDRITPAVHVDEFLVPSTATEGQPVSLSAHATTDVPDAVVSYHWNFGDGGSADGADVAHAFAAATTPYTVTLTATDNSDTDGDTQTVTAPLSVPDVPPDVFAGSAQAAHVGDTVHFNAAVSDPGGASDIADVQWDFDYDGTTFRPDPSAAGSLTPTHTYTSPGTHLVDVQVTDRAGNTSEGATAVTVKPADALLVNAGADQSVSVGDTVSLSGSYSDPGSTVSPGNVVWDLDYDGVTFHPMASGSKASTSFDAPGTYQGRCASPTTSATRTSPCCG